MKKLLILIPLLAFTQTEPKYEKFVKVEVNDIPVFIDALNKWKELEVYNPKSTDKEKIETIKAIDTYLNQFVKRVKVDSVVIKPEKK